MRDRITLLLNGNRRDIAGLAPTTTLLQWLRQEPRLTGTKEGCGEGDCGACTVVIGRLDQGRVRYTAINACIAFMPLLDQTIVLTVEGLAGPVGALHPVQQALVDCHGSQCGFCTPGFVMSLYAMYLDHTEAPSRAEINCWLAGNLCRCTGYSAIAAAAVRALEGPRPAWDQARRSADRAAVAALQHTETLTIARGDQRMFVPASLAELCDLAAAHPEATLVSGATDVGLWVTKQARSLPQLIATGRVRCDGFADVTYNRQNTTYRVGAGVTHADAAKALPIAPLTEIWRRFAGAQVRNAGTVVGNLANASPIGDLAPALIALDAKLELRLGRGVRSLPLASFFESYGVQDRHAGEVITHLVVQPPVTPESFSVYKVSKRFDDDISAVCGAFHITVDDGVIQSVRIAFGGMAEIPKPAAAVAAALRDKPWTRATIDAALPAFAVDFQPISDMRASATYRLQVAQNMLVRHFIERTEPATATRLVGAAAAFGV
jgi:xanthine dehydrogenase small subunit